MNIWTGSSQRRILLLIFLVVSMGIYSCSKKSIVRKYYLVDFPQAENTIPQQNEPLVDKFCEILPVQVATAFSSQKIAVRVHTNEISYYFYHQWAVAPGEAFTNLIENYFQRQKIFSKTSGTTWNIIPDYQIHTKVYQLEAMEEDEKLTAHLHMGMELFSRVQNEIIVTHTFDSFRPLERNDLNQFAATISSIFLEELENFSQKIETHFKNQESRQLTR